MAQWYSDNANHVGSTNPEGFVIRTTEGFSMQAFDDCVAKYVREGHIQTEDSWRRTWKAAKLRIKD